MAFGASQSGSNVPSEARGSSTMGNVPASQPKTSSRVDQKSAKGGSGRGELVAEHVLPLGFDLPSERRRADGLDGGNVDLSMVALAGEHSVHRLAHPDEVWVAMHVDHVVEIAWTTAFRQCSQLLSEQFGERIAQYGFHRQRRIAVGMSDGSQFGTFDKEFIGGDVDLHLGRRRLWVRALVGDSSLGRGFASPVPSALE